MKLFERISLREDERLRVAWEKDRIEEMRLVIQWIFLRFGVAAYLLFWFADLIYAPRLKWQFLSMRLFVAFSCMLTAVFSKRIKSLRVLERVMLVPSFFIGFFITVMIFMTEGVSSPYYAGLNLVVIFGLAFIPWSISNKVILILLIWGPYYLWGFLSSPDSAGIQLLSLHSFFNASTIVFSLVIRFFYDYLILKEFKTRFELQDEQKKLETANRLIREVFGRYLSDDVVDSILESPEGLSLGGERRRATIMITDLRGFTLISEQLKPEQVVQLLNSYFQRMFDVAQQYHGTINEISGDALLVLFGAPQQLPDRTPKAVACAIAMQNAMAEVNEANRTKDLPELEMGIGINEAEVIVGNVGSSKRSKYGVVGSGVNMTHRIQSYATGGQILISESVRKETGNILRIDDRMEVQPKGSEGPIVLYEIGGIGEPYNLVLEERETSAVSLSRELDIRYAILDGKHITPDDLPGKILTLSLNACELKIQTALEPLTNLKFKLAGVSPELESKDFYGKVEKDYCTDPCSCRVRFTALPPAIYGYFQAILDREEKDINTIHAASTG